MIDEILLDLSKQINYLAIANKARIATAESCTGGLLASCLTAIEGASNYFDYGFITYSNEAKTHMLGVDPQILERCGAVSKETAIAMAAGAMKQSKSSIALSITGIAGPGGGSTNKPVGTVYCGIASMSDSKARLFRLTGDRPLIRYKATKEALKLLLEVLEE
jgi:PncC family amidohydrolase